MQNSKVVHGKDISIISSEGETIYHQLYQVKNEFKTTVKKGILRHKPIFNDSFVFSFRSQSETDESLYLFVSTGSSNNMVSVVFNVSQQKTPLYKKYLLHSSIKNVSSVKSPIHKEKPYSASSVVVEDGSCFVIFDSIFENNQDIEQNKNKTTVTSMIESKSITQSIIFPNMNNNSLSLVVASNNGLLTFLSSFINESKQISFSVNTCFNPLQKESSISCFRISHNYLCVGYSDGTIVILDIANAFPKNDINQNQKVPQTDDLFVTKIWANQYHSGIIRSIAILSTPIIEGVLNIAFSCQDDLVYSLEIQINEEKSKETSSNEDRFTKFKQYAFSAHTSFVTSIDYDNSYVQNSNDSSSTIRYMLASGSSDFSVVFTEITKEDAESEQIFKTVSTNQFAIPVNYVRFYPNTILIIHSYGFISIFTNTKQK